MSRQGSNPGPDVVRVPSRSHDSRTRCRRYRFPLKYALVFCAVAGVCAFYAATATGLAVALWWPAISFGIAGAAYAGVGPGAFGKRDDGSLSPYSASLLPYLICTRLDEFAELLQREG